MKKYIFSVFSIFSLFYLSAQQPTQQWLNRFNGKGDYSDKFNCIANGLSGNAFLGGYTVRNGKERDYLTVKINSNGDTLWTAIFNGTDNKDDEILAITSDANENVYVTGYSRGNGTGDNIVTIKYNTLGQIQLTLTYNNTTNLHDQGNSITLDNSGNIFVTGQTDVGTSTVSNDNYVTIKYNSTGTQLWAQTYNGTGNSTDRAISILTDASGNSYITGRSNNGSNDDYVTLKYNSSGTVQWTKTLNKGNNDRPIAMVKDNSDNIYITGRSDNGADDDILTIKYTSGGIESWTNGVSYNGAGGNNDRGAAITIDGSGNVFVAGKTDIDPSGTTNYDYCTLKYNSSGSLQWAKTYNGTGDLTDEPSSIMIDASGNIIVSGHSDINNDPLVDNFNIVTIAYTTSGTQSWIQSFQGTANLDENSSVILSNDSKILVAGYSENNSKQKNAIVIQYTTSGVKNWEKIYDGQGDNSDNVNAMVVDISGDYTYLAGYTYNASSEKDMSIIKINSTGDTLWTRTYSGSDNGSDEATDIKVDGSGNVFVTGFTKENTTDYDITTLKFSATGNLIWNVSYNNSSINGEDKGSKLYIDANGNVFVSGYSDGDASSLLNEDFITIKYNSSGVQQWATRYNGSGNGTDIPVGIAAQNTGKVFVSGKSDNGNDDDYVTICYNASGVQQWIQIYDGGNGNDRPTDFVMDTWGNISITGRKTNSTDNEIYTVQYSPTGIINWSNSFNTSNDDRGTSITVDNLGNTFVTGTIDDGIQIDAVAFRISSTGTQIWQNIFSGIDNLNDIPTDIYYDNYGFAVIAGQTDVVENGITHSNFFVRKINNTGGEIWTTYYDNSIKGNDGVNALFLDGFNNVFVTGNSISQNGQKDIVTIKYDSPLLIKNLTNQNDNTYAFPNPMKEKTNIIFRNDSHEEVEMILTDISGKQVYSKISNTNQIEIDRNQLYSGIYIYKLNLNSIEIGSGKLIVE